MLAEEATKPRQRIERARRALIAAEEATGVRSVALREMAEPARLVPATRQQAAPAQQSPPSQGVALRQWTAPPQGVGAPAAIALPPALSPLSALLPHGGLRAGGTTVVSGSTSVMLQVAAGAMGASSWCAVVGYPHLGFAAAAEAGMALERLIVVPCPGPDAARVLAAVMDGVDVVLAGRAPALSQRDRRLLSARARSRGTVLLSAGQWPGAELVIHAWPEHRSGLGDGEGLLRGARWRVRVTGSGIAGSPTACVDLPDGAATDDVGEPDLVSPDAAPSRDSTLPTWRAG